LESHLERLVAGILDQFGVLEIAVGEQAKLALLFHAQAIGAGIRVPVMAWPLHVLLRHCPRVSAVPGLFPPPKDALLLPTFWSAGMAC